MSLLDYIPQEMLKTALVRGLREGGTAIIEETANELTRKQLTEFIRILVRVHDQKKQESNTIDVEVINEQKEE
jgi:hypothetical protein